MKLEKNGSTLESMNGLGLQAEAEGSEQIPFSSEVLEINVDELVSVDLWLQVPLKRY